MAKQSRLKVKSNNANGIIEELKQEKLLNERGLGILERCTDGIPDLLKRTTNKLKGGKANPHYMPELRNFALTLHKYSPKAYEFIRKTFNTCLPSVRSIHI